MKLLTKFHIAIVTAAIALALGIIKPPSVAAAEQKNETKEVKIARQYGLGYLPLIVMEERRLIEKHARSAGLGEVKTTWIALTGGAAASDALLSGSVDYVGTGVAPLITLWAKTDHEVKGVAALDSTPIVLNTANPAVKSIRDLTANDRIAVPAVKVSIQSVLLQMAAAREFGQSNYAKLDSLTVTMKHPDAAAALLSGHSEVTGHLASPPFIAQELKDSRVRSVLNSFEVLGGSHTFDVISTTKTFYEKNPATYAAVLAALEEAIDFINHDKLAAARIYIKSAKSKESEDEILAQLNDPSIAYSTTPRNVTQFSDFLFRVGAIKTRPAWKDLFFSNIHDKPGS